MKGNVDSDKLVKLMTHEQPTIGSVACGMVLNGTGVHSLDA